MLVRGLSNDSASDTVILRHTWLVSVPRDVTTTAATAVDGSGGVSDDISGDDMEIMP